MKRSLALGLALAVLAPPAAAEPPVTGAVAPPEVVATETTGSSAPTPPANAEQPERTTMREKKQRKHRRRRRVQAPSFDVTATAAWQYGRLTREACEAELTARGVPFTRESARGVLAGVRLDGPIRGVTYRTRQSEARRATSHWEIADCRLVLALDDLARILAAHDIVEVRHYSMYRATGGRAGSQHRGGLAIDAAVFTRSDGSKLDVEDDWSGRIGAKTCGPKAGPRKPTDRALELRAILCEIAAKRIFNVILTPNHNRAHRNHFHLDVTPGARWFIVD